MAFNAEARSQSVLRAQFVLGHDGLGAGQSWAGTVDISTLGLSETGNHAPFALIFGAFMEPVEGVILQLAGARPVVEDNFRREVHEQVQLVVTNGTSGTVAIPDVIVTLEGLAADVLPAGFVRSNQPAIAAAANGFRTKDTNAIDLTARWELIPQFLLDESLLRFIEVYGKRDGI